MDKFKIPEILGLILVLCDFSRVCYPGDIQTIRQASSASNES